MEFSSLERIFKMSEFELIYYNSRGYAEPVRILFSLAGKKIVSKLLNSTKSIDF
jgi:hypothetical protein